MVRRATSTREALDRFVGSEALIRKTVAEYQLLPTQVYERLTAQPVHA